MFLICGVGGRLTGRAASVYVPQTIAGKSRSVEPAVELQDFAVRSQRPLPLPRQIAPRSVTVSPFDSLAELGYSLISQT
jgi:hypothetical protein